MEGKRGGGGEVNVEPTGGGTVEFLAEPEKFSGLGEIMIFCILALGLFSSTLGRYHHRGEDSSRVRRLRGEFVGDEERGILESTELLKRSAGLDEQTCTALPGVEAALLNSTSSVSVSTATML